MQSPIDASQSPTRTKTDTANPAAIAAASLATVDNADQPTPARQQVSDLRRRTRQQCEHIMQLQRTLCHQQQQHRIDMGLKSAQMAALANQLMLLESRLRRRQTQIANVLRQREHTIVRQQRIIETLSNRLTDHGLGVSVLPDRTSAIATSDPTAAATSVIAGGTTDLDSLNDSDSAVVLDDIDLDWASGIGISHNGSGFVMRRDSNGGGGGGGGLHHNGGTLGGGSNTGEGITIIRSISDAIDTNYKQMAHSKRSNCFLRRPEMLETVYSVEEDHEQHAAGGGGDSTTSSLSASNPLQGRANINNNNPNASNRRASFVRSARFQSTRRLSGPAGTGTGASDPYANDTMASASASASSAASVSSSSYNGSDPSLTLTMRSASPERTVARTSHYNRVMSSNHRSVTKPKDVKYRRINKVKSKSLEELCGQLKRTDGVGVDGDGDDHHRDADSRCQKQQLHTNMDNYRAMSEFSDIASVGATKKQNRSGGSSNQT